ncbi:hypothetical protein FD755_022420 [Muntiacus reevesi]|uniref:B30.2/SPRY domain-containing protein n=1 Tax=Muntiacus reevesi TaxID=9886 RepID=A0A5N3W0E5_MUNRE|nr:hypothetical protein FD755_022420 [Muntiacus reevesi]
MALAREHSPLFFLLQTGKKLGPMLVSDYQAQNSIKEDLKKGMQILCKCFLIGEAGSSQLFCWIPERDWKMSSRYAPRRKRSQSHVTLDPNTAFFELFLSEDHQSVKRRNLWQNLPEKPERFSFDPCVLGHRSFSSGRHYWEVEVGDRTYWELGVCEENVDRAWGIAESPQNGFWAVELYANKYQALTSPRTALPLSEPPSRVGVFLDYEAGHVSFYSVADGSHIYTFPQASFSGPLRPFFCLWFYHPTPLTICH